MTDIEQRQVTRKARVFDFVFAVTLRKLTTRCERGEQCVLKFIDEIRHRHHGTPRVWLSIIFSEVNRKMHIKIFSVNVSFRLVRFFLFTTDTTASLIWPPCNSLV